MTNKIDFPTYETFRKLHSFKFEANGNNYELRTYPVLEMLATIKFGSDVVVGIFKNDKLLGEDFVWGLNREKYPLVVEKCKELIADNGGC